MSKVSDCCEGHVKYGDICSICGEHCTPVCEFCFDPDCDGDCEDGEMNIKIDDDDEDED